MMPATALSFSRTSFFWLRKALLGSGIILVGLVVFLLRNNRKESPANPEVIADRANDDLPPAHLSATDWPWWGGPTHNNHSPAVKSPTTWSETAGVAWKKAIPGLGHSTPIIVGD
jgi:hypothetical protein